MINHLFMVVGPSGSGKTTIVDRLKELNPELKGVVTCTSRAPRPGEIDGVHYHFRTPEFFENGLRTGEILEAENVHGNWYGTPAAGVNEVLESGHDAIMIIDYKGARSIKGHLPCATSVFVSPPDRETLRRRLADRGDDPTSIDRRLDRVAEECAVAGECDDRVGNDELDRAVTKLVAIVKMHRYRH